jgi:hypothetical protein
VQQSYLNAHQSYLHAHQSYLHAHQSYVHARIVKICAQKRQEIGRFLLPYANQQCSNVQIFQCSNLQIFKLKS